MDPAAVAFSSPPRVMTSADIFLADQRYLHLEQDARQGLGWWLVDGAGRVTLSVGAAADLAPPSLAREIVLEVEELVNMVERHHGRPDLDTSTWRAATAELRDGARSARGALRDKGYLRDLGPLDGERAAV